MSPRPGVVGREEGFPVCATLAPHPQQNGLGEGEIGAVVFLALRCMGLRVGKGLECIQKV